MSIAGLLVALALSVSGCSNGATAGAGSTGSSTATKTPGAHMAGPVVDLKVDASVVNAKPAPWKLNTPEDAIRSYLDWTSYAYRIGQSTVSESVMTPQEGVRVDSYIQYNVEKKQLLQQKLDSITFGAPSKTASATLVPAKEKWTYSYLSIDAGNKVLNGPYTVSYDSTYTVVKGKNGLWLVDRIKATPKGTVK